MSSDIVLRGGVRLPCSSDRNSRDRFAKLLSHVTEADQGFGFEGKFLRPGATLTEAELRPTAAYPPVPILLEYMRGPAYKTESGRRTDSIYILWRYDREANTWRELGRATSFSWEWALDLRPLAMRALREARGGALVRVMPDLVAIAGRIATVLDGELKPLEAAERSKVLGVLHDQLAARLCA